MDPEQIPLRDLHLPEAIGWWPLAPGWWALLALACVGLAYLLHLWLRARSRSAARRFALRELQHLVGELDEHKNTVKFGSDVSQLLRRTMLAYAPRLDIAGLTGEQWLAWLDQDLAQPVFTQGPGRQLLEVPYQNPENVASIQDMERLIAAVKHRLATPVGGRR